MLTSLRIQNFRSIRDASVKLGQVNLFIGPNNSGKSNFLKGVTMFGAYLKIFPKGYPLSEQNFQALLPRSLSDAEKKSKIMRFAAQLAESNSKNKSVSLIIGRAFNHEQFDEEGKFAQEVDVTSDVNAIHDFDGFYYSEGYSSEEEVPSLIWQTQRLFTDNTLYKFEPAGFALSSGLSDEPFISANGRNIANFLYTLSQNHEKQFAALKLDLAKCVGSLISVSTPPDPFKKGNLRLKFFDDKGDSYWAEEVSEGVLYFLALLCIVHQPDPPKLLLLEEPEKGIHPRRIKEVMDFIFELARLRDIQIILTSHSPYVVDHFADIPECISVFDRENGETVIHNAADIIKETNDKLEAAGQKPIRYTDALGEYWVSGFLGGVPL